MKKTKFSHLIFIIMTIALLLSFTLTSAASGSAQADGTKDEAYDTADAEKESFFDVLFVGIEENMSSILSALAFIGSVIVMFCYKKGLIPIISDGIKALAGGVKQLGEKSNSIATDVEENAKFIEEKLLTVNELIQKMESALSLLEANEKNENSNKLHRAKIETVLNTQTEIMYEIFMSADLPQYIKDNIGEKLGNMKKSLCEVSADESAN